MRWRQAEKKIKVKHIEKQGEMMSKLEGKSPPPTRELWDPAAL